LFGEDMTKKICPNCKGNGYLRLAFEAEEVVEQCKVCKSQGELDEDKYYSQSWQEPDSPMRTIYFGPLLDPESFPEYKIESD
tara:strand:- start:84 stop:329 length:246 start_codon:yes stop_codon:yes gene_type:complete